MTHQDIRTEKIGSEQIIAITKRLRQDVGANGEIVASTLGELRFMLCSWRAREPERRERGRGERDSGGA